MIGAMQDVTGHRILEKKLMQEVVNRKRAIITAIISAQEKEKKEISDELHDNVNQILATCNLYLDLLIKKAKTPAMLKECKGLLKTAIEELRNISHNLTPAAFGEKGLFPTIREMTEKINRLGTLAIKLNFIETDLLEEHLLPEMKTAIYRIIQEQVKNVLKHSEANQLKITVQYAANKINLQITDNGKGFNLRSLKRGLGLNNIQSRISLFNGEMIIRSSPGKGCAIKAVFPFDPGNPLKQVKDH